MASSSFTLPSLQAPLLHKPQFLGQPHFCSHLHKSSSAVPTTHSTFKLSPSAKFNFSEMLGGRGLCNGEQGLQQELKRNISEQSQPASASDQEKPSSNELSAVDSIPENGFDKELLGLTGGFPGGEKGLQQFLEKNPPPKKAPVVKTDNILGLVSSKKAKPPELPLLLPGMIAIVSNPNNPYYMYCGTIQRISDGKAGVLLSGGNWDRLITFRLEELERREKGPPMVNPKSVVLESLVEKES